MKALRFFCSLGVALSLAGIADCATRYFAMENIIDSYERSEPRFIDKAFEEMVAGAQYGKYAIQIYQTQVQWIKNDRTAAIELYRAIQAVARQQGFHFSFLFLLFALALNRVSGAPLTHGPTANGPRKP